MGGWVGGGLEKWGLKLISTQVVVEVEVGVELGNRSHIPRLRVENEEEIEEREQDLRREQKHLEEAMDREQVGWELRKECWKEGDYQEHGRKTNRSKEQQ